MSKVEINIVYAPGTGSPSIIYENEHGVVWNNKDYDATKHNVGMGWYSIRNPKPEDSILVVEPYCVLPRDYEVGFIKQFKYIFTWAIEGMSSIVCDKIISINHPTYHNIPDLVQLSNNWKPWNERENEIVIIANNKSSDHYSELYSLRIHLADVLSAFSSFKVSWYGQIPIKRPYFKGPVGNKEEILSKAKFSICTENSYDPKFTNNYFTEKMPDVWTYGAVPIYMGCYNINDMGNFNNCYIDLRSFVEKKERSWSVNKEGLNDVIVNFSEQQYKDYIENLKNNVAKAGVLEKHHSYKNVYEKIINSYLG